MRALRLTTWNVLHRVHAVNWKETPVATFPVEAERIAAIAKTVADWLASGVDVVCLQEVSGDQLASLRRALGDSVHLFEHLYPRLPRLRGGGPAELADATEHLVTLVSASCEHARRIDARTFDDDPGKGLLAVDVGDDIAVINTHVTWGGKRDAQLPILATLARAARGGAVVLGDFNASPVVVRLALGEPVVLADLDGQRPTRTATHDHEAHTIDHVAVFGGVVESATVLDGRGLSDHEPVTATLRFG
jgi:endonuclease/exonuclease/phosphatase family metal-dependent hydrolase